MTSPQNHLGLAGRSSLPGNLLVCSTRASDGADNGSPPADDGKPDGGLILSA